MAKNSVQQNEQIITQEASAAGIPAYIPLTIAAVESSYDETQNTIDSNGYYSTGLFQLNQNGVGAGHSIDSLKDPYTNASIAIPRMVPAYQAGAAAGLQGLDLVAYTANNSGWPGNMGVAWTKQHTNYDQKLASAYMQGDGTGSYVDGHTVPPNSSYTSMQGSSTGHAGIIAQLATWEQFQSLSDWEAQNKRGGLTDPAAAFDWMGAQAPAVGMAVVCVLLGLILVIFGLVQSVKNS